jgi:hypothetical protein
MEAPDVTKTVNALRERFFGMVEELWKRNRTVRPDVIEREIQEAVRGIRAKAAVRRVPARRHDSSGARCQRLRECRLEPEGQSRKDPERRILTPTAFLETIGLPQR